MKIKAQNINRIKSVTAGISSNNDPVNLENDIICNMCGQSLWDWYNYNGLVETEIVAGPDSTHLNDLSTYTFSLCESCLTKVFRLFIIQPEIKDKE